MERRTIKRSNWELGSAWVPVVPKGFWVAIQINGVGKGLVTPSTVTLRSSMASRRADCVLGEVRLISSASSRLHIAAPS